MVYEHEKACSLNNIKASRQGLRIVNKCATTFPELRDICLSIITIEQANIQKEFDNLIRIERNNNERMG